MKIELNENGIWIDGSCQVILASSLFYFRIPQERWEQRMKLLKAAGYNAIDVYFPWNYHETAPGKWNFEENRDVERFLKIAKENELFVIARPGPYICSEWDGGAIPAWLYADGIPVRQDDPAFLNAMRTWYSHILPILDRYQITKQGSIICMQIENELDFYDCKSPVTYMGKLKKMAESFGMEIPLFYCCGQDDIVKSGGLTDGLYSAFNVYSPGDFKGLEQRALHLNEAAALRKMPFMITETNREHDFLKRLLACGAKLLGPYNQTSGTTMDFYTGITNWGPKDAPVAIMATDYDFKSMIGSAGNYDEAILKARLFAGLLHTFGAAIGTGKPEKSSAVLSGVRVNEVVPELKTDMGSLLDVSNLGEKQTVGLLLDGETYEISMDCRETKLLPVNVKVTETAKICFSNYELASILEEDGRTVVWLYGIGNAVLTVEEKGVSDTICIGEPENGRRVQKGRLLFCFGRYDYVSEHGLPFLPPLAVSPGEQEENVSGVRTTIYDCELETKQCENGEIVPMEYFGQYRGIGRYEMELPEKGAYLLSGLADIVTITQKEKKEVFYANGSTAVRNFEAGALQIMTEIWGHANFDDIRVKSLRMGSLKGMETLLQITRTEDLTNDWRGYETDEMPRQTCYFRHSPYNAIMNADGYNRAASPLVTLINRTICSPKGEDGLFLQFEKAECMISVYVNNKKAASVVKDDPYVDLSAYAGQGELELTLYVYRRYYTDEMGSVTLFAGRKVRECQYGAVEPKRGEKAGTRLPLALSEGENKMLEVKADAAPGEDLKLFFAGKNVKITVYAGDHVMGRIYFSEKDTPVVGGGTVDTALVLGEWLQDAAVRIWCQAIGEGAKVERITVKRYKSGVQ